MNKDLVKNIIILVLVVIATVFISRSYRSDQVIEQAQVIQNLNNNLAQMQAIHRETNRLLSTVTWGNKESIATWNKLGYDKVTK